MKRSVLLITIGLLSYSAFGQAESITERVARLELRMSSSALLEMSDKTEQLQNEVQRLRGQVEQQANEIAKLKQWQEKVAAQQPAPPPAEEGPGFYDDGTGAIDATALPVSPSGAVDDDNRSEPAESGGEPAPSNSGEGVSTVATEPLPPRDSADKAIYDQALEQLKQGQHKAAIGAFKAFLERYPNSQYADNAEYWMAEANYATHDFFTAQRGFQNVVKHYPGSNKVPDALMKMGFIAYEEARWGDARTFFNDLVSRYPESNAAQLAKKRLELMDRDQR